MPLQYLSVADVPSTLIGTALALQIAALPTSALDKALFQASSRVNSCTKRRLGAPQSTVVASPGISAGTTLLTVASTLSIDNGQDLGVIIGAGATRETIPVVPGSVVVTTYTPPYAGTVKLAQPCVYAHNAGESVQYVYIDVQEVGSSSSDDVLAAAITQQAQMALAHTAGMQLGNYSRTIMLPEYPIVTLYSAQSSYSYDAQYFLLDISDALIEQSLGYFTLDVGSPVFEHSYFQTVYTAGMLAMDEDIKLATSYYLADALMPLIMATGGGIGTTKITMGKRSVSYSIDGKTGKSMYALQAEEMLQPYKRVMI